MIFSVGAGNSGFNVAITNGVCDSLFPEAHPRTYVSLSDPQHALSTELKAKINVGSGFQCTTTGSTVEKNGNVMKHNLCLLGNRNYCEWYFQLVNQ